MIVLDPADNVNVTVTWTNLGPGSEHHIAAMTYSAPAGLTITPQGFTNTTSSFRVTGLVHGLTYQIEAQATLASGEVLNRNIPIRAFNG